LTLILDVDRLEIEWSLATVTDISFFSFNESNKCDAVLTRCLTFASSVFAVCHVNNFNLEELKLRTDTYITQ